MALCIRTSTATSRAIPLFSASSTPSEKASICTARLRFTAIFMDKATPLSPTYVTFGPISRSKSFKRSKVSLRPPTITESLPCCRVITLPDTGASIMSAPFSRTFAASARLTSGLTVLMSMWNLPAPIPASDPSGPSVTAASAAAFVTIVNVTSDAAAAPLGESAKFIPLSINHCALERVRLKPVTACPFSSRRATMLPPITPRPMNPSFAIQQFPFACEFDLRYELLLTERRRIHEHLLEMGAHGCPRRVRIAFFNRREDAFVMELASLRSSVHIEDAAALLAQQTDNRIQKGEDQRIPGSFRKRQMEVEIR